MESHRHDAVFRDWVQRQQDKRRPLAGVSFQHLACHGFQSSATFQHTVTSYALAIPHYIARYLKGQRPTRVQILRDFDGLAKPGEMVLVLGRPGSGCSSLLKVLSGYTHGIYVGEESKISYGGISYGRMHAKFPAESLYLAELDAHFPELTLGETLTFAASTRELGSGSRAQSQANARDVAALFGLSGAYDTKMGNAVIRGVSGGETRRTSIAEALMGGAQFQCWDNSTRGLDSATAQRFIDLLRMSTDAVRSTAIMSLYQASDAMYNRFDKVMLLYQGRQIYFGPTASAAQYFHELGFAKPERATVADFLTSLTNPAERIVRPGFEHRAPRSPSEFADAWKHSPDAARLAEDIAAFNSAQAAPKPHAADRLLSEMDSSSYLLPVHQQIRVCVQRGFDRLRNNYVPAVSTVFANGILAIVVGSVYYDLPETTDSMSRRSVLIFFSLMICAFSPAFEVLTMWAQRPIVEKHHRYALYHPFAEAMASMICDLPTKLATSILFHVTLYFMTNLRRTASAFFTHLLFMFFVVLTMSMVFRTLGSMSRTLEQTMAPASVVVLLCIVYTGFVIPVPYMKPWLSWFRWLNPMAYVYESLMINEFNNRQFPCSSTVPSGPGYTDQQGLSGKVCPVVGAEPGEENVEGASFLRLSYGYDPNHLWRNFGILIAMMVAFCCIHLLATEYIPAQRSKGEVLLFQRNHQQSQPRIRSDSEEAAPSPAFAQEIIKQELPGQDNVQDPALPTLFRHSSVFHWENLSYEVKVKNGTKKILSNINGWVKPGTMTALMGVTGAGKTTLLDVLANRASFGTASGGIYVDGSPRDLSFQRKIGYVQQEDIHLPTATVREALEFSALLRQPGPGSRAEKLDYVNNVIRMLDMDLYAEAVVGTPGNGLNIEQRKRLSIGVELVAKPELLLFLDEPTSGLDSQTAWSICVLLRRLADHGQAILCTIHQPSSQLFQMFDRLLLLTNKGETAYFGDIGPDASTLVGYFENRGATKCPPGANPAEWILNVVTRSNTNDGPQEETSAESVSVAQSQETERSYWGSQWEKSKQHEEAKASIMQHVKAVRPEPANTPGVEQSEGEFSASYAQQMSVVTRRLFKDYWRDPSYLYSKLGLCAGVCFLNGLSFYDTDLDIQGFTNFLFSIFLITQLFSTLDQQIIPRLVAGRSLFEARERRSKSYSWIVFLSSNVIVELWWQTVASVVVFASWYYLTLLWQNGDESFGTAERGALVFVLIWLFCLWLTTFSQAVGIGFEHDEQAVQIATLCFWLSLVFCGVLVTPNQLPEFWFFVYRASPLTYFVNGIVLGGLANTRIECADVQLLRIEIPSASSASTCGEYLGPFMQYAGGRLMNPNDTTRCLYCPFDQTNDVLRQTGMETENAWHNVGYLTVYVIFNTLAIFGIYWLARGMKMKKEN
ncbi:ABC-2 type transporter-domain-containing protein [Stachybotrys elegans]|uniref:ABC-2 type transporter-domain-containing protein n=1 Tax=Stachybotrys elegans TaxID=80388 RepID=A0A8K0SW40_9HYPO|nr:ABC-2 type transporter-domain-containing protein [Stachybotrys elegans]